MRIKKILIDYFINRIVKRIIKKIMGMKGFRMLSENSGFKKIWKVVGVFEFKIVVY